jgi:predicted NUDIX family NTP pyrophosphohydrolase
MYRLCNNELEVFLVHPGGPLWRNKDAGCWSIPKGEYTVEEPFAAAKREFFEETGYQAVGEFISLTPIRQASGKLVTAWAFEGNYDASKITSNTFVLEWPPKSGQKQNFPEVDRAEWFGLTQAKLKINAAQVHLLNELQNILQKRGRLKLDVETNEIYTLPEAPIKE